MALYRDLCTSDVWSNPGHEAQPSDLDLTTRHTRHECINPYTCHNHFIICSPTRDGYFFSIISENGRNSVMVRRTEHDVGCCYFTSAISSFMVHVHLPFIAMLNNVAGI